MEKISGIVRGNSRVTTADNKNAAPARTGMPTFGRPAGESTPAVPKTTSTASRAVALHNGINEAKKAMSQERVISHMADEFFMSRVRPDAVKVEDLPAMDMVVAEDKVMSADEELPTEELVQAQAATEYTPRGSFIDVRV